MKKILVAILALAMMVPSVALPVFSEATDWPEPFYNPSHTNNSNGPAVPIPLQKSWTYYPEGNSLGLPIAVGDSIIVSDTMGYIVSLDRKTGQPKWSYDIGFESQTLLAGSGDKLVFATASIMMVGGGGGRRRGGRGGGGGRPLSTINQFVQLPCSVMEDEMPESFFGILDIKNGNEIWKKKAEPGLMIGQGCITGNKIIIPFSAMKSDGTVTSRISAFSINDGSQIWSMDYDKSTASSIATAGEGKIFIGAMTIKIPQDDKTIPEMKDPELLCIDESNGKLVWKQGGFEENLMGMLSYADGTIYTCLTKIDLTGGGGGRFTLPESNISAFNTSDGSRKWVRKIDGDFMTTGIMAVTRYGLIIQCTMSSTMCLDLKEGTVKWNQDKTPGGMSFGIQYVCNSEQVISTRQSKISVINLSDGKIVFQEDTGMKSGFGMMGGDMVLSYPVVSGDMVFVAGDKLVAFGEKIIGLSSDPDRIKFNIEAGQSKTLKLKLVYNAQAEIKGTVMTSQPWIKLSSNDYSTASQTYEITFSTEGLEPGTHKGSIDVDASVGKLSIPVEMTVVPKPPIKLEINLEDPTYTNKNPFKVIGQTIPGAKLTISGRPVNVASDGSFAEEIPLEQGQNKLVFEAKDTKGNIATKTRIVIFDDKKPQLNISLKDGDTIKKFPFAISGQTEKNAKIKVNGVPVEVGSNGEFEAVIEELEQGEQTITITAEDLAGNVTKIERKVMVATLEVKLVIDQKSPILTNNPKITITGQTEPGASIAAIILGGEPTEPATADQDGKFSITVTLEEEGQFRIILQVMTEGGQSTNANMDVLFDKTPPSIESTIPSVSKEKTVEIKGKLSEYCMLTINDNPVEVSKTGFTFSTMIELKPGLNPVIIKATDMVGNTSKLEGFTKFEDPTQVQAVVIKLWVDKQDMTINGKAIKLAVAPTTSSPPLPKQLSGSTYMPIREVAEALFASVGWDAKDQKVTLTQKTPDGKTKVIELWIGKKVARIDGKEINIDSQGKLYPTIVQGKTMLPLRFVGEALGAKVEWDGKTKMITLTFPK
ncbi:MAG: PQQ-binding-like beta-propeller repeat protein [Caldisericales bacterium]|nr:PQQ-binding-like beta-propeller repeat protein [Caldisericales bacterium]